MTLFVIGGLEFPWLHAKPLRFQRYVNGDFNGFIFQSQFLRGRQEICNNLYLSHGFIRGEKACPLVVWVINSVTYLWSHQKMSKSIFYSSPYALKAQDISAQGNALGGYPPNAGALKGRDIRHYFMATCTKGHAMPAWRLGFLKRPETTKYHPWFSSLRIFSIAIATLGNSSEPICHTISKLTPK